jgi:SSS family solute:Na+ symporter
VSGSTTVIAVVVAYLAACLWLGMRAGKGASDSAAGYVAGDRAMGPVLMYFITGATIFSAFTFLGMPGWAYSRGAASFYILAYGILGFVPFFFLGPRAARLGREHGFVTQAELVAHQCGSRAIAGAMALVSALAFVPYLALQIKGAGLVIDRVTAHRVPEWLGGAIAYSVVLAYVLKSGVLGVGWTNVFQGILMMVLAWAFGLWLPWKLYGGVGPMFERIEGARPELLEAPGLTAGGAPWTWLGFGSSVLISTLGFSCWPHLFMKAFTARDEHTLRRTVVLYPTFLLFQVPIFLIGFAGVLFEPRPADTDQVLPHLLMSMELPAVVVGLFCAGALAAGMSSGDAIVHASASILVRDGWITALGKKLSPHSERAAVRWLVVGLMLASYAFFLLWPDDIVSLLLYAYGPVAQFAPALVISLYAKRPNGRAVLAGLVAGTLTSVAVKAGWIATPIAVHEGIWGIAVNLAVLALLWFMAPTRAGSSARA